MLPISTYTFFLAGLNRRICIGSKWIEFNVKTKILGFKIVLYCPVKYFSTLEHLTLVPNQIEVTNWILCGYTSIIRLPEFI